MPKVGEPFEVQLPAPGGAGYLWELEAPPGGVRLLGTRHGAVPGAPGDGGKQFFQLQADAVGTVQLRFVLKRRWEAAGVETRLVEVEVR